MEEIWKDIQNYEGIYQISNKGNVKVVRKNTLRRPSFDSCGYLRVTLGKPKHKQKTYSIHRLVAIHFLDIVIGKKEVNHIDGNKLNNSFDNLEWCSRSENVKHAYRTGLDSNPFGEKSKAAKLTSIIVNRCIELRKQGLVYRIIRDIIEEEFDVNVTKEAINSALLGITWSNVDETKNNKFRLQDK